MQTTPEESTQIQGKQQAVLSPLHYYSTKKELEDAVRQQLCQGIWDHRHQRGCLVREEWQEEIIEGLKKDDLGFTNTYDCLIPFSVRGEKAGVDINITTEQDITLLHISAIFNCSQLATEIIKSAPDLISTLDKKFPTPLHLAAERDYVAGATALVENGAKLDPIKGSRSPLEEAYCRGSWKVAVYLKEKGASLPSWEKRENAFLDYLVANKEELLGKTPIELRIIAGRFEKSESRLTPEELRTRANEIAEGKFPETRLEETNIGSQERGEDGPSTGRIGK